MSMEGPPKTPEFENSLIPEAESEQRERIHERVITAEGRDLFCSDLISGDCNPIHLGPDAISHGMHIISMVSGAVVAEFGEGTRVTGISDLDLRSSVGIGEPFKIHFGEPTPKLDSKFGEVEVAAVITKTKLISDPQGGPGRPIDKRFMGAKFSIILPPEPTKKVDGLDEVQTDQLG